MNWFDTLLEFLKNNLVVVILSCVIALLLIVLIVLVIRYEKIIRTLKSDDSEYALIKEKRQLQKIKKKKENAEKTKVSKEKVVKEKKKKAKITRVKIDDEFIEILYLGLGGKSNIQEILIDNGRLKFNIVNLKLLNKEHLDKISQSGVFITGKFVKLLFKYDANDIKEALERK